MRIGVATREAVKYACLTFHYAKRLPASYSAAYSVFTDDEEWCGAVIFGLGASRHISTNLKLVSGQVMELQRVALNGKQLITTKAVMMCIRQLKIDFPLLKCLVSFADSKQGHIGIIYQAMNWIYSGESSNISHEAVLSDGRVIHSRTFGNNKSFNKSHNNFSIRKASKKYRYYYQIDRDKALKSRLEALRLPYPKKIQITNNA